MGLSTEKIERAAQPKENEMCYWDIRSTLLERIIKDGRAFSITALRSLSYCFKSFAFVVVQSALGFASQICMSLNETDSPATVRPILVLSTSIALCEP